MASTARAAGGFLLDDHVELIDHRGVDLAGAREATYVVANEVTYEYPAPIRSLHHRFVVIPRRHHGDQRCVAHRIHTDAPRRATVQRRDDHFGNAVVELRAGEIADRFSFAVRAVVHRRRGRPDERPWHALHAAPTPLIRADDALREVADDIAAGTSGLDAAIAIGEAVRGEIDYVPGATNVRTTAAEAWALGRGVCQDMAHVMIAMCRARGLRARYVSGHLLGDGASHAWVEIQDRRADSDATGRTLAYDPTHARQADLRYVTVAVGRDYRDVAPTAGSYRAGPAGRLTVHKQVSLASIG